MLNLNVRNEFGTLKTAIVHVANNFVDISTEDWHSLVPSNILQEHPETKPVSKNLAIAQQLSYLDLLKEIGVNLLFPEVQDNAFCQVFTRDPCFVIGNTLFIGSLCDTYRHPETSGLSNIFSQVEQIIDLRGDGALIEGGDVMILKNASVVLVGTHRHTNEIGFEKLRNHLYKNDIETVRVLHKALHLDCCLSPLPDQTALYALNKLPESSRDLLANYFDSIYPLDKSESELNLAANLFWINAKTVISNIHASKTNAFLRDKGYKVYEIDFSEFIATWGSFRCVTCPIYRE